MIVTSRGRQGKWDGERCEPKGACCCCSTAAKARAELCCPVCRITLWPGMVEQHYQQELAKLGSTTPSLAHSKKRTSHPGASWEGKAEGRRKKLIKEAQQVRQPSLNCTCLTVENQNSELDNIDYTRAMLWAPLNGLRFSMDIGKTP